MSLQDRSFIRIAGFEICHNTNLTDGSGIRLVGACQDIGIYSNTIHNMRGSNAMAITVYGTAAVPASNIIIAANHIYDCQAAPSEALTLNGNVTDFLVESNLIHDINNIAIDFIGGEAEISPPGVCRRGICRGNRVYRARSIYGGGYGAGIYVDGGRDIIIERNAVWECDLGIEIGAENAGYDATGIVVRSNCIFHNDKAGLVFGGYEAAVGRTRNCCFLNNTCYQNDTLADGNGELWIQYASNNVVENNIFYCGPQKLLIGSAAGNRNNSLDYNTWYADSGAAAAEFTWNGAHYIGFNAYRSGTGQDAHSQFANPQLLAPSATNFHVSPTSPVINAGNPWHPYTVTEKDCDGQTRVMGDRVDCGADETSFYERWRDQWFGDLPDYQTNQNGAAYSRAGDYDADRCDNEAEFVGDTNPRNPTNYFRLNSIMRSATNVQINWPARTNRTYAPSWSFSQHIANRSWDYNAPSFCVKSNNASYPYFISPFTNIAFFRLSATE